MTDAGGRWSADDWLLSTQQLQETSFDKVYPMTGDVLADDVMMNHSAAIIELGEFMAEVGWKPWAKPRGWINRDAAVGELVDTMHFLGNLFVAMGVTDEELAVRYPRKQAINAQRQVDGYDGRNKCRGCGRALDDPTTMCVAKVHIENDAWCTEKGFLPIPL